MSETQSEHPQAETPPAPKTGLGGLAHSIGTRNLWLIILTMPAVFLVAVAAIIAIFGKPKKDEAELAAPVSVEGTAVAETPPSDRAALSLARGEAAGAIALDGDRLAVRVSGPDGEWVYVYDLRDGATIARLPIVMTPVE